MRILIASTLFAILGELSAQATWQRAYPTSSPPYAENHCLAFQRSSATILMFGGVDGQGQLGPSWRWNGTNWALTGGAQPPNRTHHDMVHDAGRDVVVLFGGSGSAGSLNDTWEWNGSTWSQRLPAVSPGARNGHAMAYDPLRQRTVLFGGNNGSPLNDTWEWNGTNWQQLPTTVAPTPRAQAAMAFDHVNDGVVLFGGGHLGVDYGDFWIWDGSTWTQLQPLILPYPRSAHVLVSDAARQRVVLHGGAGDALSWEWDGTHWLPLSPASPGPRQNCGATYDALRREIVLTAGSQITHDTWRYRTPNPAMFIPYGVGCPGSAGTPVLGVVDDLPWIGSTFGTRASNLGGASAVLFAFGFAPTPPLNLFPLGLPACDAFLTLDQVVLVPVVAGVADWSVQIPNATLLAGAQLFQQALSIDAGAPGGAAVSNAAEMVGGIR